MVFDFVPQNLYLKRIIAYLRKQDKIPKMKFFATLSMVVFLAFAIAGPVLANSQDQGRVEKRQVYAHPIDLER